MKTFGQSLRRVGIATLLLCFLFGSTCFGQAIKPIKVMFLGDQGHHRPSDFFRAIQGPMSKFGIEVTYSEDLKGTLEASTLAKYDALLVYANTDDLPAPQEKALLEYVESGKGFVPVHCASYCFRNSQAYVDLVGAQFQEHGAQRFETSLVNRDHPILKNFSGFESWDETYIHTKHNTKDRVVLEERRRGKLAPNTTGEPWTWVRTQGKGRIFYTAWGHNMDTWSNPGFQNLLARGITWSTNGDPTKLPEYRDPNIFERPEMTPARKDVAQFTFADVGKEIPNYTPGAKWGTQEEPKSTMQNPLSVAESVKHYITPQDFQVDVWATEKDSVDGPSNEAYAGLAGKPIAMTWDHRGRLWLCETLDYPNELQPRGKGRDRIRICEDTNRDGKADKFTVFATNLSIPTSMAFYRGGVLVQDGTKTVYLKDTTGDDVADMRQELITGWALQDTHGGVSNFQYGLDNWIWAMQGYNDSKPVINGEKQQGFRQGFWRFAVEAAPSADTSPVYAIKDGQAQTDRSTSFDNDSVRVSKLEFVRSTNNNTWGLGISEEGLIFGSTANGNPSNFMPIANQYYERVQGWSPEVLKTIADSYKFEAITPNVRQVDWHGGYTAGAGHALYTARRYPSNWWNRLAFVCEPTGHLVGSFVLTADGAGFKSTSPFNLIASDDQWASPIMAEVGPDGNMWVLDWYNFIVQHNPTPQGFETGKGAAYETKLRDKRFGRVYRVVYSGNQGEDEKTLAKFDAMIANGLNETKEVDLVQVLRHPTMLWRKQAQRLLVEKKSLQPETVQALEALVADNSTGPLGLNVGAIHALWVLSAQQKLSPKTVALAIRHPSAGVRRNAITVAGNSKESVAAIIEAKSLTDGDVQVRLAALLKLSDLNSEVGSLATTLARPDILAATTKGSDSTIDPWLLDAWTSAAAIHYAEVLPEIVKSKELKLSPSIAKQLSIVAEHAARSKMKTEIFAAIVDASASPEIGAAIVQGFSRGWPRDYQLTVDDRIAATVASKWLQGDWPIETKSQVVQLASSVGIKNLEKVIASIRSELITMVGNKNAGEGERLAAAKQAMMLEPTNAELLDALLAQITPQSSPTFSSGIVTALSVCRVEDIADRLIQRGKGLPPEFTKSAVRLLLSRPETTLQLISAIENGSLTVDDLQLDQKQLLREHPDKKISERAVAMMKASGGIPNPDRVKVVESWMSITEESGDVAAGKLLYQKHCALCHKHGDMGVTIGPELTGMAVHPKAELLMNILDPSRSVEGNFRTYNVLTTDGEIVTGMLAGESKTSIEIVNVQGKREVVLREDIERLTSSQKSLMPEGFESQVTRDEMKNLLEFLTSKGKYVPISIQSVATSITTRGMFFEPTGTMERLVFPDWAPKIYKDIPFVLIDPQDGRVPNAVMLYGPNGNFAPKMPKEVEMACNTPAVAIHMLSGIGGWSFPASPAGTTSMIVRLTFADDSTEDHELVNGEHFADYIRRVDVPKSEFAFDLAGRQMRYLVVKPNAKKALKKIGLIKGKDTTAPIVMAITVQTTE